jgi:outer membrane protein
MLKSSDYNSYYYGLTRYDVKAGIEWSAGIIASWQAWRNLYFYGSAKLTYLDKNVRDLEIIKSDFVPEFFVGFGLSNDRSKPRKDELSITPYIRVAHGWASTSSLNEILRFQNVPDPYNNQLSSIFYGHPLTDRIFTLPVHFYLTSGFIWHYGSSVQEIAQEIALGVKFYVTVPWPVRWRIGFAEGWSYVNKVPYVEAQEQINKDYKPSKLLNYLDPSLDINIGDIFGGEQLKHWWLGYSMHHRSGIFGSAQQFGRISGGSNYNTIYLLYHF